MNEDKMRKDFEEIIAKDCGDLSTFGTGANMHYKNSYVNHEWIGYKMGHRAATRAAVPEGWKVVPAEPTDLMVHAAMYVDISYDDRVCIYKAMLSATPEVKP